MAANDEQDGPGGKKPETKAEAGKDNRDKPAETQSESKGEAVKPQVQAQRLPPSGNGQNGGAHAANGNGNGNGGGGRHDPRDAIALLTADHRAVEQNFTRFAKASQRTEKARIARDICNALIVHTLLEEEIFYPACSEQGVEQDQLHEAQVEHDGAKILIVELMQGSPDDPFFDAKLKALCEQIRHHVGEEEKPGEGIFARALAAGVDTAELGRRIAQRKAALMRLAEADRLPRPIPYSFRSDHGSQRRQTRSMMEDEDMAQYYQQDYSQGRSSGRGRGSMGNERPRDEYGRFMSDDEDDDRGGGGRSRSSRGRGGYDEDDGRGYGGGRSRAAQSRDRDDYGRFISEDEDGGRGRGGSRGGGGRSRYEDDGDGRGGWFGDSEGHSRASRLGWERSDHEGSGWYGDPEGHSEASRLGWEHRDDRGRDGRGGSRDSGRGRGRYADDDDRGGRGGSNRGGWFGDSEGHSRASRRGWDDRR